MSDICDERYAALAADTERTHHREMDRLRQDLLDQQERQVADLRALTERTTAAAYSNRAEYPPSEPRAEVPQHSWPIHRARNLGEEDESPPSSP